LPGMGAGREERLAGAWVVIGCNPGWLRKLS
jgi:hypothetical protein